MNITHKLIEKTSMMPEFSGTGRGYGHSAAYVRQDPRRKKTEEDYAKMAAAERKRERKRNLKK